MPPNTVPGELVDLLTRIKAVKLRDDEWIAPARAILNSLAALRGSVVTEKESSLKKQEQLFNALKAHNAALLKQMTESEKWQYSLLFLAAKKSITSKKLTLDDYVREFFNERLKIYLAHRTLYLSAIKTATEIRKLLGK